MEKVECIECKTLILPATAEKNNGLCMPCKKLKDTSPSVPPAKAAFYISASVLLVNALVSASLLINIGKLTPFALSVIIDLALAVFLSKGDERVRYLVVARAILGLIIYGALNIAQFTGSVLIEHIIAQIALSGSLILLLAWKTVNWRLFIGIVLSIVYFVYLLLVTYVSLFSHNA